MSIIDSIMSQKSAQWVNKKIEELPDRSKFAAANSIRALDWANRIYEAGMPIPACYCALHATEEAVAAFVSCVKECDYGDDAKINIRDHQAKATVSLLTQKISNILQEFQPAIALDEKNDQLVARLTVGGDHLHNALSLKLLHFKDTDEKPTTEFYDHLVATFESVEDLKKSVITGKEARNKIFYADAKGYPTGFDEPEHSLQRECHISL